MGMYPNDFEIALIISTYDRTTAQSNTGLNCMMNYVLVNRIDSASFLYSFYLYLFFRSTVRISNDSHFLFILHPLYLNISNL
jgi:hypothetical protein